jgi:hypothetical protein
MKYIFLLITIFFTITVQAQINSNDLDGKWVTINENEEYRTNDTLSFYQDINHEFPEKCCNFINWNIKSTNLKIENLFACSEPGIIKTYNTKYRIKVRNVNSSSLVTIYENGQPLSEYKVVKFEKKRVERYPYDIKILMLKRVK